MTIHVRNWEKFQHADVTKRGRPPAWIRLYTELLDDPTFLALTPEQRSLLVGLWMLYAKTRRNIPESTRELSRHLHQRVTKRQLEALNHAGWIEFRQDSVTPVSSLEERRGETTVRSDVVEDVAALDLEALSASWPDYEMRADPNVVDLDSRRGGEVNGKPMQDVIGGLLDEMRGETG